MASALSFTAWIVSWMSLLLIERIASRSSISARPMSSSFVVIRQLPERVPSVPLGLGDRRSAALHRVVDLERVRHERAGVVELHDGACALATGVEHREREV